MKLNELRRQFLIFIIFAGILTAALIVVPLVEMTLSKYITNLFASTDAQMGETANEFFTQILRIFKILLWMTLIVTIVRFTNTFIFGAAFRKTSSQELSTLIRNVLSIIIYVVAFFVIFNSQYPTVNLAALFTTSTIIAVVIGLALQDTLGNLFAGIALQADQSFQIGDVINIPTKGAGVVEGVSWRGVKIRTFQNKLVIISNSVIGKEAIEVSPHDNLNARTVNFSTLYSDSPAKTIYVVRDVVRNVENVSPKMRPVVRIRNLGDSGIEWEIKYWLEDYTKYNDTDALIRQRVWYVFQRENIEFPYPTRTIHVETKMQDHVFDETANDVYERLSNVPIFAPLNDEETKKLAKGALVRVFAPNEAIVRKGEEGGSMFVVHRGSVRIQLLENGFPKTLTTLGEGEIFGEMGLFTGAPRTADVVAAQETEVLEINNAAVKPLLEENPTLAEALSKTIAERRAMLAEKDAEISRMMPEEESSGIFNSIKRFFGLSE
ncbi:MAG: cyclic nucleotide-binding domain-containing protein [Pyrinomonadaceae bacterium]